MVETIWDEIESNTVPTEVFQESMAKYWFFKVLNNLGDKAPQAIIVLAILLRFLVILYSTYLGRGS